MARRKTIETRTLGELRAVDGDEGIIEGYIAVWDTVDSYDSSFKRGSFSKTIQERADKVKVYYNHDHLIGKSLTIKEDDHGVHVRGQLTLTVQKAADVMEFIRDETLSGLSFGFQVIKEAYHEGIRQIQEVRLFEYGPVDFPANDAAQITGHRAERIIAGEDRATDFTETLTAHDLAGRGWDLLGALDNTLQDIWWGDDSRPDDVVNLVDAAIAEFHAAYLEWSAAYIARFWSDESRSVPNANALATLMSDHLLSIGATPESFAESSAFTVDEVRKLRQGQIISARDKLLSLPDPIVNAHRELRSSAVETLCSDIRDGLTAAERRRLLALLGPAVPQQSEPDAGAAIAAHLQSLRQTLGANPNG